MDDAIRVHGDFYIKASASLLDSRTQVLKHGDTVALFDRRGDISDFSDPQGLYRQDTRFLSTLVLTLNGQHPILLNSSVSHDNILLAVDLTNDDFRADGQVLLPRGALYMSRSKFLWRGVCYERLSTFNYTLSPVQASFEFTFESDFVDVFEVRGVTRQRRGRYRPVAVGESGVTLSYEGLDGVVRRLVLRCSPKPKRVTERSIELELLIEPKAETTCFLSASCDVGPLLAVSSISFDHALRKAEEAAHNFRSEHCVIYTDNEQFNEWLSRSASDLRMLISETPTGPYPHAGVPWSSTEFGRDGILTALQTLWFDPGIARGVLAYLAATQAQEVNRATYAEPGKIMDETRKGEMAALKEVPFERYYGSVDATPLFITLAASYYHQTHDRKFLEQIWANIRLALEWIKTYGDCDGDGFVEQQTSQSTAGVMQQGGKDSDDSIFHVNGSLAEPPIALSEVQGYVYAAKYGAARLADAMRDFEAAAALRREAQLLRKHFEDAFWCEDISTYALALDGLKRPCKVRTSNAGHALLTRIASARHAQRLVETLFCPDLFSGWGIRTVSTAEHRYKPASYHNGSVWPHDNALIASGLARYGFSEAASRLLVALFDASTVFNLHRLPQFFCGFVRQSREAPVEHPVACLPHACSAAAVFMLLGACLGLSIKGAPLEVRFTRAFLPSSISQVQIKNLRVADSSVDLSMNRVEHDVAIQVLRKDGEVAIISSK